MTTPRPTSPIAIAIAVLLAFGLAALAWTAPTPARADQETERVAAVVNDEAITLYDLDQRVRLALLSSNLPDNVQTRRGIAPQVLRRLVDERLQLQEANHLGIKIAPYEITHGIDTIEKQNNMAHGSFLPMLKSKGIDPEIVRQQVRAELSWVQIIRREIVPTIHIGEGEIDARLAAFKANRGKPEYLVAEIFLAVDEPRHDEEVRNLMDRLIDQMRQGAPFSVIARQFSQSAASNGGEIGWISEGMIDEHLMAALTDLEPNHISPPIRTEDGYHLLYLLDKRIAGQNISIEPTFNLLSLVEHDLPSDTEQDRKLKLGQIVTAIKEGKSCDDYERIVRDKFPAVEIIHTENIKPSEIPVAVRSIITQLATGSFSDPVNDEGGAHIFALCGRKDASPDGLPSRDDVKARIQDERVDIAARRYMRDLRRAAFVEFRI